VEVAPEEVVVVDSEVVPEVTLRETKALCFAETKERLYGLIQRAMTGAYIM
jgi:hypothetical protein